MTTHYKISIFFEVDIKNLPPKMQEKLSEILEEVKNKQVAKNKKMRIDVEKVEE